MVDMNDIDDLFDESSHSYAMDFPLSHLPSSASCRLDAIDKMPVKEISLNTTNEVIEVMEISLKDVLSSAHDDSQDAQIWSTMGDDKSWLSDEELFSFDSENAKKINGVDSTKSSGLSGDGKRKSFFIRCSNQSSDFSTLADSCSEDDFLTDPDEPKERGRGRARGRSNEDDLGASHAHSVLSVYSGSAYSGSTRRSRSRSAGPIYSRRANSMSSDDEALPVIMDQKDMRRRRFRKAADAASTRSGSGSGDESADSAIATTKSGKSKAKKTGKKRERRAGRRPTRPDAEETGNTNEAKSTEEGASRGRGRTSNRSIEVDNQQAQPMKCRSRSRSAGPVIGRSRDLKLSDARPSSSTNKSSRSIRVTGPEDDVDESEKGGGKSPEHVSSPADASAVKRQGSDKLRRQGSLPSSSVSRHKSSGSRHKRVDAIEQALAVALEETTGDQLAVSKGSGQNKKKSTSDKDSSRKKKDVSSKVADEEKGAKTPSQRRRTLKVDSNHEKDDQNSNDNTESTDSSSDISEIEKEKEKTTKRSSKNDRENSAKKSERKKSRSGEEKNDADPMKYTEKEKKTEAAEKKKGSLDEQKKSRHRGKTEDQETKEVAKPRRSNTVEMDDDKFDNSQALEPKEKSSHNRRGSVGEISRNDSKGKKKIKKESERGRRRDDRKSVSRRGRSRSDGPEYRRRDFTDDQAAIGSLHKRLISTTIDTADEDGDKDRSETVNKASANEVTIESDIVGQESKKDSGRGRRRASVNNGKSASRRSRSRSDGPEYRRRNFTDDQAPIGSLHKRLISTTIDTADEDGDKDRSETVNKESANEVTTESDIVGQEAKKDSGRGRRRASVNNGKSSSRRSRSRSDGPEYRRRNFTGDNEEQEFSLTRRSKTVELDEDKSAEELAKGSVRSPHRSSLADIEKISKDGDVVGQGAKKDTGRGRRRDNGKSANRRSRSRSDGPEYRRRESIGDQEAQDFTLPRRSKTVELDEGNNKSVEEPTRSARCSSIADTSKVSNQGDVVGEGAKKDAGRGRRRGSVNNGKAVSRRSRSRSDGPDYRRREFTDDQEVQDFTISRRSKTVELDEDKDDNATGQDVKKSMVELKRGSDRGRRSNGLDISNHANINVPVAKNLAERGRRRGSVGDNTSSNRRSRSRSDGPEYRRHNVLNQVAETFTPSRHRRTIEVEDVLSDSKTTLEADQVAIRRDDLGGGSRHNRLFKEHSDRSFATTISRRSMVPCTPTTPFTSRRLSVRNVDLQQFKKDPLSTSGHRVATVPNSSLTNRKETIRKDVMDQAWVRRRNRASLGDSQTDKPAMCEKPTLAQAALHLRKSSAS